MVSLTRRPSVPVSARWAVPSWDTSWVIIRRLIRQWERFLGAPLVGPSATAWISKMNDTAANSSTATVKVVGTAMATTTAMGIRAITTAGGINARAGLA